MNFLVRNKTITAAPFFSFEEEIERRVRAGDTESFIYIVPTGAWAREFITRIVAFAAPKAIRLPHIISLQEFVTKLHVHVRPYKRIISDAESTVLIELAVSELFAENALNYYEERESRGRSLPIPKGTFEKLTSAFVGMKKRGISPKKLLEDIRKAEKESGSMTAELRRAKDLHSIYERYEKKLGTTLTDTYGAYSDIIQYLSLPASEHSPLELQQITDFFRRSYPDVRDVFVGTFIDMDEPARLIVNAMSLTEDLSMYLKVEDASLNQTVFASQHEFIERQKIEGYRMIGSSPPVSTDTPKGFAAMLPEITKRLFLYRDRRKQAIKIPASNSLHHFTAPDVRAEITYVARKIKQIALTNSPAALSHICVAMHRQDDHASMIEEIFTEYGIPVQLTERRSLSASPVFAAIESLFRLAELKLNRRELVRLLHSPYFLIKNDSQEPIDALSLADVISELRLPGGVHSWNPLLTRERERITHELQIADFEDEYEGRELQILLKKVRKAETDIIVVERLIYRLSIAKTPAEFFTMLRDVMGGFAMKGQLIASDEAMLAAHALEADTRSYKALTEALEEVEHIIVALGLREEKLPLEFYTERIRVAALQKRFAPRVEPGQGVIITSFDQTAGYTFDHLFLIGLTDGSFPELYEPSIFAMKAHQRSEGENLASQRYQFFQTLASSNGHVYLSWSVGNTQREKRAPSTFVEALIDIATSEDITASLASPKQVYSRQELLLHVGSSLRRNKPFVLSKDIILDDEGKRLLDVTIPRAIAAERERAAISRSSFGGYINISALPEELQARFAAYRDRVYSASQLETYAKCPFQYFSRYVLGLVEPSTDEEEGMTAMERGTLLHKRLHIMLKNIHDDGRDLRGMSYNDFRSYDPYYQNYDELAKHTPAARHPFWRIDMETMLDPADSKSVFERFLEAEQSSTRTTTPSRFEYGFPEHSIAEEGGDGDVPRTFKLRGKIDRIDIDEESGIYAIVDYKSGVPPTEKDIRSGKSLQLPLYLRVADDLLRSEMGVEGVAALYHKLLGDKGGKSAALVIEEFSEKVFKKQSRSNQLGFIKSAEELREVIEQTVRYANSYIGGITKGEFPLVKKEDRKVCEYCPYHNACRVEAAERAGMLRE